MTRWFAALALVASIGAPARTLTVCTEANPDGFDDALFHANSTADAFSEALDNRLVEFEPGTTHLVPALAERWDISPDDAPWVPLTYPTTAIATRASVRGMKVSPFGLNNYAQVTLP